MTCKPGRWSFTIWQSTAMAPAAVEACQANP